MPYDILRAMQEMQQQGAGAAPEDAARRFARRRLLMGLQGGLGAGVEAGGGFFGNLLRGASGSLGGTLQANQMQHEDERQAIRDTAEQRRLTNEDAYRQRTESRAIETQGWQRQDQQWQANDRLTPKSAGYGAKPWWVDPSVDPTLAAQAKEDAFRAPEDAGGIDPASMDPRTKMMLGQLVRTQGPSSITGLFRGKDASRGIAAVLHEAANPTQGDPNSPPIPNLAQTGADYKTNVASYQNIKKLYDNSTAFEKTAASNSRLVFSAIDKIPDYGNEPANMLMRAIARKSGDPNMSAFDVARKVAFTEWARLVGSPGAAGGVITDTQLKELDHLLSGGATRDQMRASVGQFIQDGMNKRKAYSEQMDQLRNRTSYDPNSGGQNPNENVYGSDVSAGDAGAPAGDVAEEYQRINGKLVRVR